MSDNKPQSGSPEQDMAPSKTFLARQRKRSIAIALTLALLVLMFYLLTIVKMGPDLFDRAL